MSNLTVICITIFVAVLVSQLIVEIFRLIRTKMVINETKKFYEEQMSKFASSKNFSMMSINDLLDERDDDDQLH